MKPNLGALAGLVRNGIRFLVGRPRRSPPTSVVLWGKPNCSLCAKAEAILDRLARDFPLDIEKRDITADAEAFERYRFVIPVVEFVGGPIFEGKITEHRLRQTLLDRRELRDP